MSDRPVKPRRSRLTRKQQDWAVGYLAHGNASQAATEAGYSHIQRGWENVQKSVAEIFLEDLGDTSGALDKVTPDALFAKLMDAVEKAEQEGTKIRGIELAMRAKGMFTDRVQVEHKQGDISDRLEALKAKSPELYELVAGRLGATEH